MICATQHKIIIITIKTITIKTIITINNGSGAEGGMPSLSDVLDQIFESVCKPLEVRIDSVLNSVPAPLTCYKLSQVRGALGTLRFLARLVVI